MFNEILFAASVLLMLIFTFFALLKGRDYLIALVLVWGTLANFFVIKEITLFGWAVSGTDAFFVGIVLAINFLEEFFGKKSAAKAISCYSFSMLLFLVFKSIHLAFEPSTFDTTQEHFLVILSPGNRIILSTIVVSYITLHLDRILYRFLSRFMDVRYLFLKNFLTGSVSQLLDTILFSYLAVSSYFSNMKELITFSYFVKIIALASMSPILAFTHKIVGYFNVHLVDANQSDS